MDNDTKGLLLIMTLAAGLFVYTGYYFGRKIERVYWVKFMPDEMNKLCMECAGIRPRGN